ncbi:MAG: hypothetical protein ACOY90_01745 [Candidatus Zhuqueibacterota bacterium]
MRESLQDKTADKGLINGAETEPHYRLSMSVKFNEALADRRENYQSVKYQNVDPGGAIHSVADLKKLLALAEGSLMRINDNVLAMQKKMFQAVNERSILAERFLFSMKLESLNDEIDRIVLQTRYGNDTLLNGSFGRREFVLAGAIPEALVISLKDDCSSASLGTRSLTENFSHESLGVIEQAIQQISQLQHQVGEWINRILFMEDDVKVTPGLPEAWSNRKSDYDLQSAREKLECHKFQIMQNTAVALIERSNTEPVNLRALFKNPE